MAAIHVYRAVPTRESLSVEAAVKQPPGTSAAAEVLKKPAAGTLRARTRGRAAGPRAGNDER